MSSSISLIHIGADPILPVLKVLGAAAAADESFDDCLSVGKAVVEQIVSVASTLDHCHVPCRTEHAMLDENEIEIGTGPHNEPVRSTLSSPCSHC